MTAPLQGRKIAFLVAAEGVEQIELTSPWRAVREAGGTPRLVSREHGTVQAFDHLDKAGTFPVDDTLEEVASVDFDGLVLPGGVANPDSLRLDPDAVRFAKDFFDEGRPVAAICHAPWLLIEAGAVRGRTLTSWPSLCTDITNAGGTWLDQEVVVDPSGSNVLVTSRRPDDLKAFEAAFVTAFADHTPGRG
ncbi:type 1 glutamine amidotransferase domain-containing protein [Streptomyces sp. NPDC002574]|uniref:type 1 glutamine amidotransferase domain-containing protein n=1 Tax=Streptomyces sp. NPDC002574 TaxID=3364652 RepID=UPI0036CCB593